MATDFNDDPSDKILLSHVARPLTAKEKEIGSGAPFGTVDVLIPGYQDIMWRVACTYLQAYFPETPHHRLQTLLNNPVVSFNPETILIREGTCNDDIFLILAGNVEMIEAESHAINILSVGAIIGEISGLHGQPSSGTYRASSYVRALQLPSAQYIEFINKNNLLDEISRLMEARNFLKRTRLFSEALSYPTQNLVAKAMTLVELGKHPKISDLPDDHIYLVHDGMIMRLNDDAEGEPLLSGDFFGEESALMGEDRRFSLHAKEPAQAYSVPNTVFLHVPVVRWKLFETYCRRLKK
jgi:hemerythrin